MKFNKLTAIACVVLCTSASIQASPKAKGPVKVFILAGQSNMEGKAARSTLEPVLADPKEAPKFKHLKTDGKWTVRDDVWVTFLRKSAKGPKGEHPLHGPLSVHFGSDKNARDAKGNRIKIAGFGPELGIGHVLGDKIDQQVLLIKAAWGGRSVNRTFRPPSAMPNEAEIKEVFENTKIKNPDARLSEIKDSYGRDYRAMLDEVRKVTGDIKKYFSDYDEKHGFEIAGFIWFQGWNDGCGQGNPKYTEQLAALIRDIRKDLKTPKMPVVIGELGIDGDNPMGWIKTFRDQQAAIAAMPEFKGNVVLAKTAQCWPPWYKALDDKWKAFKAKERAWKAKMSAEGKRLTRDEITRFGDENWRNPNKDTIARMSDRRYHYMGCGRTYYLMGESMGKAMLELMEK